MSTTPLRVALYLRVSKDDNKQTVENQRRELRAYCERMGYQIAGEYVDQESGRRGKAERRGFSRLFEDAAQRTFDLVLFWALDRFSREGIRKTIHYLQQPWAAGASASRATPSRTSTRPTNSSRTFCSAC